MLLLYATRYVINLERGFLGSYIYFVGLINRDKKSGKLIHPQNS